MALELKFDISYTDDVSLIYITDTTGVYSASNITGWGTPNTNRADVALLAYVEYHPFEGDVVNLTNLALPPQDVLDYSGNTSKQFNLKYYKDGWHTIILVAVPVYTDANAINNVTADNIYYSLTANALRYFDGVAVKEIETQAEWGTIKTSGYTQTEANIIPLLKLTQQYDCLLESYFTALSNNKDHTVIEANLIQLHSLIQATTYRFYSNKEYEAQKMTENLTKQFKCCK